MPMTYVGIANFDPNNYVISDGITADIWHAIGLMQFRQDLFDRIQTMNRMETQQFDNYLYFRANLVSAYYGTPPARRLRLIQSFASLSLNGSTSPDHNGRRPLGASFLIDMRTHIENYKSLHATPSEFEEFALRDNAEYRVGDSIVSRRLLNIRFNLTEDRLIRDMAKNLADANPDWRVSKIKLPNGFYIELDPEKDSDFRTERLAYLRTGPVATQKSP